MESNVSAHPTAGPKPKATDCFIRILRTSRQVSAMETDQAGKRVAVDRDQSAPAEPRQASGAFDPFAWVQFGSVRRQRF
jgi:hypothetical protein